MEQTDHTPSQVLLKAIGGQATIARAHKLSDAAVSYWGKKGIPRGWEGMLRLSYPGEHWDAYDAAKAARQPVKEGA